MSLISLKCPPSGISLGGKRLFRGFSLEWRQGEHWGVIGPNGSGKSVLVQLLSGTLYLPDVEVEYGFEGPEGSDPERAICVVSLEEQARILAQMEAYVQMRWNSSEEESSPLVCDWLSQDSVEERSPFERIHRSCASARRFAAQRAELARRMDVERLFGRRFASLSNGESRRTMLVRSLLKSPRVMIFDAPYIGLDVASRELLRSQINSLLSGDGASTAVMLSCVRAEELPQGLTHIVELGTQGEVLYAGPFAKSRFGTAATKKRTRKVEHSAYPYSTVHRPTHFAMDGTPSGGRVLVQMRSVEVVYGGEKIIDGLTWEVREGERWLLTGPNGCGKTTLLAFIIGDHPQAYSNDVRLFGRRRGSGESIWSIKRRIGWVSPELHACMDRTQDVLSVVLSGYCDTPYGEVVRTPSKLARARQLLAAMNLSTAQTMPFGDLSGGEQRLVLLARAVVKKPPLLVLDEPCQNLDTRNRDIFVDMVDKLCSDPATTLIYVTHLSDTVPTCITHHITATIR